MIVPAQVFKSIGPLSAAEGSTAGIAKWSVPGDLPYLNGHFPGSPIFPAVGILDASTYLIQRTLNRPELEVKSVDSAKFLSTIVPDQPLLIELIPAGEKSWDVEWKEDGTNRILASLRLTFN